MLDCGHVRFDESSPGLLHVHYDQGSDLEVGRQRALVERLEQKRGPVVLLFEVGAAVRSVPLDVPTFWLGITARQELGLCGMGIITTSAAVRAAARGFGLANAVRRLTLEVKTFGEAAEARGWAQGLLAPH